jgi:ATP-dependent Lhr-like helicase
MNEALEAWFERRGWQPFDFQLESAAAWRAGEHGLIHAPTGTGKTVAAMLGPLEDALEQGGAGQKQAPPLRVLWITPLRALAQDTAAGLRDLLTDLDLPWTLDLRTGDTGSSARARQRRRLPSVLVTTPESLSLLLSYSDTQRQLAQVATVVVDEWHELLASKRGTLLELALARVRSLAPYARIWGLSATLANLDEALTTLTAGAPNARLIRGEVPRALHIDSLRPAPGERFPWAGHLGTRMVQPVVEAIEASEGSTLLFTNTRSQAEHWFEALLRACRTGSRRLRCTTARSTATCARAWSSGCGRARCAASSPPAVSTSAWISRLWRASSRWAVRAASAG